MDISKIFNEEKIGVTIMRCQPPHKGHTHIIQSLRKAGCHQVIVFMTGNNNDLKENPFPFELRKAMLRHQLDFLGLLPVYIYQARTGHLETLIKENIADFDREQYDFLFAAGKDRIETFKDQIENRCNLKENDSIKILEVDEIPDIHGTQFREALKNDDKEKCKEMINWSVNITAQKFGKFYKEMKKILNNRGNND